MFFSLLFINLFLASTNFVKPVISFEGGRFSFAAVSGLTSWRTTVELSSSAAVHCCVDAVLAPVPISSGFSVSFRSFFGLVSDYQPPDHAFTSLPWKPSLRNLTAVWRHLWRQDTASRPQAPHRNFVTWSDVMGSFYFCKIRPHLWQEPLGSCLWLFCTVWKGLHN